MNDAMVAPHILLVEPHFVLRRTIVTVARELGVGALHEAASNAAALPLLAARSFDGVVLDTGDADPTLQLLVRLRAGVFASPADVPVVALVALDDRAAIEARFEPYGVCDLLGKPFKVGELLQLLRRMRR